MEVRNRSSTTRKMGAWLSVGGRRVAVRYKRPYDSGAYDASKRQKGGGDGYRHAPRNYRGLFRPADSVLSGWQGVQ